MTPFSVTEFIREGKSCGAHTCSVTALQKLQRSSVLQPGQVPQYLGETFLQITVFLAEIF